MFNLTPCTFLTIASPHLGTRTFAMLPLPSSLHGFSPLFIGQTGRDLFLLDQEASVLVSGIHVIVMKMFFFFINKKNKKKRSKNSQMKMTDPNSVFMQALASFKLRVAFANKSGDMLVPMETAAFIDGEIGHTAISESLASVSPFIKHVLETQPAAALVATSISTSTSTSTSAPTSVALAQVQLEAQSQPSQTQVTVPATQGYELEARMRDRLNQLGWTKILVEFPASCSFGLPLTHNMISAIERNFFFTWLFKDGRSVMEYATKILVDQINHLEDPIPEPAPLPDESSTPAGTTTTIVATNVTVNDSNSSLLEDSSS
jgi:hypothetical protein